MPKEPNHPLLLDKRVVERNIKKGLLTRDEYDQHLAALADVGEQAETIRARLGEADEELEAADEGDDEGDDASGEESDADEG